MNILFFLTPKNEVAYVENDDTLRQVLEKIEYHKYTAIPMLNKNGKYVGTVTEGDLLRYIKEKWFLNIREAEDCSISRVPLRWKYQTVDINCNMEDLVDTAMKQNFVPVLDDADNFIGIVRRSDILKYCYKQSKAGRQKQEEAQQMKDRSDPWNKNKQSLLSFFMWAGNLERVCIKTVDRGADRVNSFSYQPVCP